VVINLGLTAVSLFGVVISIFIGIGLVSKEIDKRTLYTVLSRPVQRWEFHSGEFFGSAGGTLAVNNGLPWPLGVPLAAVCRAQRLQRADSSILVALYFIVLQFVNHHGACLLFLIILIASAFGCISLCLVR